MKKRTLGLEALALTLGVIGVSAGTALAYQGDPTIKGPHYSVERHEAMEKAFENKDYDAWKEALPAQAKSMMGQAITEENFAKFSEMHELMEQGKTAEAQQIRQELGLGLHNGSQKGMGGANMHRGMNR